MYFANTFKDGKPVAVVVARQSAAGGNYRAPTVAKILGRDPVKDWVTRLVKATSKERGGEWWFPLFEDGIYRVDDRASNGELRRQWVAVASGFPEIVPPDAVDRVLDSYYPPEPKEAP